MNGQLARLFDDDPRLAEFTEKADTASPLKQALVLNEIKDYASRQAEQGNALFAFEVIERQNERYHGGEFKFSKQGSRFGTTADEVIDTLSHRFGKDTIAKLQANNSLKVLSLAQARQQFGNIPDNVDGFYVNGTAYLIHDNIHPDMIVPTFLHELGGHGGLQTLMSDSAYQGFMTEFDKLVASGDKLAQQAKALAEKNSNSKDEAQDEYLPYLITLASRQKEQQGKIKGLINRMMMAIRTFVREKLGVSLPVTPDEIVAVAEKAVKERASVRMGKTPSPVQFSQETPQTEIDRVREKYEGTNEWLKAPNGKKSKLTEQQWLQVRTPSFKAWFGDWEDGNAEFSEVVDGTTREPLVVRHFTGDNFTIFDDTKADGFWFTDKKELDDEVGAFSSDNVIEVFLNIRESTTTPNSDIKDFFDDNPEYDGGINLYEGENGEFTDYVVVNPSQIKSATDNIGTFDPNNDDIRFSQTEQNILNKSAKTVMLNLEGWSGNSTQLKHLARQFYTDNLQGEVFHNADMGIDVILSSEGKGESFGTSKNARNNWRAEIVRVLPQLIENAVRAQTLPPDARKVNTTKQMHTLVVPLAVNDNLYTVKITLREALNGPEPRNKFYNVVAFELHKKSDTATGLSKTASQHSVPPSVIVSQLIEPIQALDHLKNDTTLDNLDIQFSRMADFYEQNEKQFLRRF